MNTQQFHTNTAPRELTLMDLLNARENRVRHQHTLLNAHPGAVLVSMTLNIPGSIKDSPQYRGALETGFHRLKEMLVGGESPSQESALAQALQDHCFAILHEEFRPLVTGPEAYLVVRSSAANSAADFVNFALNIKKAAVSVEEGSALGRLFDIDVLVSGEDTDLGMHEDPSNLSDGILNYPRSISRSQLGIKPRQCLLCEEGAKVCARSQAHTIDQLLKKINEILSEAGL